MTKTERFFNLHRRGAPLVLANCWDAASARVIETAGAAALATSSAGVAWALGYADGEAVDTGELFAAIRRIARVTHVPLSADLEAGFGPAPADAIRSLERAIGAGASGANVEDYDNATHDVVAIATHVRRIAAMRERADELGVRFFINARTDVLLHDLGPAETRVDVAIERLRAYVAAGADGAFVPGVTDAATIARIVAAIEAPVNVLAGPASPPVAELARLGVARVSTGSLPMRRTLGVLDALARELHERGTYAFATEPSLGYADVNASFAMPA